MRGCEVVRNILRHASYLQVLNYYTFETYLQVLGSENVVKSNYHQFVKENHLIFMDKSYKKFMSCYDDKRAIGSCGVHTWAYFDVNTPKNHICKCGIVKKPLP